MTKSSKIFTCTAGLYLFALIFLLLSQPQSGYAISSREILQHYIVYLPLWISIAIIVFIFSRRRYKAWNEIFFSRRNLFITIVIFLIVGFIFKFDYLRQEGCLVQEEEMFSLRKCIISFCSLLFLVVGYYFGTSKFGVFLILVEFLFWTSKSVFYNNSLDAALSGYFVMTSWIIRFLFIVKTLNMKIEKASVRIQ